MTNLYLCLLRPVAQNPVSFKVAHIRLFLALPSTYTVTVYYYHSLLVYTTTMVSNKCLSIGKQGMVIVFDLIAYYSNNITC